MKISSKEKQKIGQQKQKKNKSNKK